jgi:hypothetical protein
MNTWDCMRLTIVMSQLNPRLQEEIRRFKIILDSGKHSIATKAKNVVARSLRAYTVSLVLL